jgi:hypothetical protein
MEAGAQIPRRLGAVRVDADRRCSLYAVAFLFRRIANQSCILFTKAQTVDRLVLHSYRIAPVFDC